MGRLTEGRRVTRVRRSFGILLSLLSSSAVGQGFEAVGEARNFPFDAPDGRYMHWETPVSCSVNAINGAVRFQRYGKPTTQWHPGITVFVRYHEKSVERLVRLAFHARKYHPPFEVELSSAQVDLHTQAHRIFQVRPGVNDKFSFSMQWNSVGDVAASVDGETHTFRMGMRPERVEINGSTGTGVVTFQLGHIRSVKEGDCKPIA
jgi:hypothetical protein